jgi:alkylhydroperoxidase family enzyme
MARLPYLDQDALPEAYRYLFDNLARGSGRVGNLFRTLAYNPRLLHQFMRLGNDLRNATALDPVLRELAILTVGRLAGALYEYAHHVEIGKAAGLTERQIEGLAVWQRHPAFDDQQRAVIRYAEEVTLNVRPSDEAWQALAAFLPAEELVELTLNIAFYNCVVRFLEPLGVDLEEGY